MNKRRKIMKKLLLVLIIVFCLSTMISFAGQENFGKRAMFVSPMFGINSYAVPFGASVEYGISERIGVGATLLFQSWGEELDFLGYNYGYNITLTTPSVQVLYHFTGIEMGKIDLYTGFNLGFSSVSVSWKDDLGSSNDELVGTSGLHFSSLAGIRYYLSPGMALTAAVNYSAVGDWSGVNALLGVTFKLN
jgi:hypothetical protein